MSSRLHYFVRLQCTVTMCCEVYWERTKWCVMQFLVPTGEIASTAVGTLIYFRDYSNIIAYIAIFLCRHRSLAKTRGLLRS